MIISANFYDGIFYNDSLEDSRQVNEQAFIELMYNQFYQWTDVKLFDKIHADLSISSVKELIRVFGIKKL